MTTKLKEYQVLDVLCSGTFYKVRHKVTNKLFAWKAYNCSPFSNEQIKIIISEVKIISEVNSEILLSYYDTILHAPSKTLYFVLEYNSWQSLGELMSICEATDKYIAESFIWYLLHELARVCKAIEHLKLVVVQKCITAETIFINQDGKLRINCFDLFSTSVSNSDMMRQIGNVIKSLCFLSDVSNKKVNEFIYSDDLEDVVSFLINDKNFSLSPDIILYHPTVLSNLETMRGPKNVGEILISSLHKFKTSEVNKCDSEKVVELQRTIEPTPRSISKIPDSPIYVNISPQKSCSNEIEEYNSNSASLSPTIAALALELPGFVPRSRKPLKDVDTYNGPQKVTEEIFSQQWMSRLIALREREESLNQRERELIAKEITTSPSTTIARSKKYVMDAHETDSNGITLPPLFKVANDERAKWSSRRRYHKSNSIRKVHRKSYAYEDLDSSLSADNGDTSIIVTGMKFTKDNMPCRTIFPSTTTRKVHFTSSNPFTDSDESVNLQFYELDHVSCSDAVLEHNGTLSRDASKFKYFNDKKISEKRNVINQLNVSSPPKQTKVFNDITNTKLAILTNSPCMTSLTSKSSNTSQCSTISITASKTQFLEQSVNNLSEGTIANRTRSATGKSLAITPMVQSTDVKKPKSRKSLLSFKTPFKFMTATKI